MSTEAALTPARLKEIADGIHGRLPGWWEQYGREAAALLLAEVRRLADERDKWKTAAAAARRQLNAIADIIMEDA